MLTQADAARLAEAFRLLQSDRVDDASAIAREIAARVPAAAAPQHMLALCYKARGEFERALQAFDTARARAPDDPDLLNNHANLLLRVGRCREAADSLQRLLSIRPGQPGAWRSLASARRACGDLAGAEQALRRALDLEPGDGASWVNLGVARRLLGDPADALRCYDKARRAGFTGVEIDDAEASARLDLGETREALEIARRLTRTAPGYAAGHALLTHILWEHGADLAPGEDPRDSYRAALALQPDNLALRRAFVRFLLDAHADDEALAELRVLRGIDDAAEFAGMEADVLERLGEHRAAAELFAKTYPALRNDPGFLNLYARHRLRARDAAAAAELALEALSFEPYNQLSLAFLGVAWRLGGDPREEWLCGYDTLVAELEVGPPPGFGDEAAFLEALEATLVPMHTARREPVDQSARGGSQTPGVLFGRADAVIAALRDVLAATVARYVESLPNDDAHPFLKRKSAGIRFAGSWSVCLRSAGRHVNHYHQQGWISSAYYVSLPPSVANARGEDTAGCLQFGAPPAELGLDLAPRRVLRPRAGHLVLFPSYLWHGTVPFHDEAARLSVAFDAVPSVNPVSNPG